jgi:Zn-dependent protease
VIGSIDIATVAFFVAALIPSLTLHEVSHGFAADRMGDPTPRAMGRLSLNPVRHADPFGTVILPGILLLAPLFSRDIGLPVFAYAKPMPFNPANLKEPDRQSMWIALAGPIMNLALAAIGALTLRLLASEAGVFLAEFGDAGMLVFREIGERFGLLPQLLGIFVFLNILLAVFNVMPIPPLDGSKVLARFLPERAAQVYRSWEPYGALFILVIFFLFPGPVFGIVFAIVHGLLGVLVG